MSWHFLQEGAEASWEGSSLDGAPSALLRLIPTPAACCSPDNETEFCRCSLSGTTCAHSMGTLGVATSMLCREDSHAKTSAPPARERALTVLEADSGATWRGSFARYDPDTASWKTHQRSLLGDWDGYSGTWPRWGSMRNGECWERATLAHATDEIESGFVPTVLTSEATGPGLHGNGSHNFRTWFRENSTARRLPLHGEIMMLWPEGWASAGASLATDRYQQWLRLHGAFSVRNSHTSCSKSEAK